jgi:hypothetical protein
MVKAMTRISNGLLLDHGVKHVPALCVYMVCACVYTCIHTTHTHTHNHTHTHTHTHTHRYAQTPGLVTGYSQHDSDMHRGASVPKRTHFLGEDDPPDKVPVIERERARARESVCERESMCVCVCVL